jgi:hypothetical protein
MVFQLLPQLNIFIMPNIYSPTKSYMDQTIVPHPPLPSECLALWQHQQLNVFVLYASSVVDMLGAHLSTSVLPLLKAMYCICLFSWYYTYSIHLHQLTMDFHWCNTHHIQKSKHSSCFKVCHGSSRPSIFNMTHLWYPIQWHNLYVLITCLNLQSHDTI